jgi:cytochrome P450
MTASSLYAEIYKQETRQNPYPVFEQLRETPVARTDDGTYVVSGYAEIVSLLHDPRMSSDQSKRGGAASQLVGAGGTNPAFINSDPPVHDRLRRMATNYFGPPNSPDKVANLEPFITDTVNGLIDDFADQKQIDVTEQYAYQMPVSAICRVLGVPREDEPKFHGWSQVLINALGAARAPQETDEQKAAVQEAIQNALKANQELSEYLLNLANEHRKNPGDDIISGLATEDGADGKMADQDIMGTARLLLIAGHETTVNLISNGTLTLLRHPEHIDRVVNEPGFVIKVIEELLRYEPPVQLIPNRTTLEDIAVGETTIPAGSPVTLAVAAGNRDPRQFDDPNTFNPDRPYEQHLGLGGGVHYCFGAPMARLEVQIALVALFRRMENPRLLEDPPPYRPSPILRGPEHLHVEVDGIKPA